MPEQIKDSVFILTAKEALVQHIKNTVLKNGLTPADNNSPLGSYSYIEEMLKKSGNLSFIRNDIISFIKNKKFPFMFIMDLRIKTGDQDSLTVLKTLLITYIILSKSDYSKDILLNLAILAGSEDYKKLYSIIQNHSLLLNILNTGDPKINKVIEEFKVKKELFNNHLTISIIEESGDYFKLEANLNLFIHKIKLKEKLRDKRRMKTRKSSTRIENQKTDSAQIIYSNGAELFINGERSEIIDPEKHSNINPGEFYIQGLFTGYNRLETVNRLLKLIRKGVNDKVKFDRDDDILINISSECHIDATIPITLAQLIIKDLQDYKKIKIKVNNENSKIMQGSQGYSLLKKYIIFGND